MGEGAIILAVTISNLVGDSLSCNPIRWNENQQCNVAIKDIPIRREGQEIETGTYVLTVRKLKIIVRLTTTQKRTLWSMCDRGDKVTITAGDWTYTALLRKRDAKYIHSKDVTDQPWFTTLLFDVETFSYSP